MKYATAALAVLLALAAAPPIIPAAVARPFRIVDDLFPPSPAGRCAKEFIEMINDPTAARVKAFETTWASRARLDRTPIAERVERTGDLHEQWGAITASEVSRTPDQSVFVTASTPNGFSLEMTFHMAATEPGKLESVEIAAASEGGMSHEVAAEARAQTVQGVAEALRKGYVFPDKGAAMADALLAKLKAGGYDDIVSEAALARRLTDDCRAITNDRHLGIGLAPGSSSAHAGPPGPENIRRGNFGFKRVEVLPGNIGYLRFDMFHDGPEACTVASNAMNFLAGTDAIIFDMRSNGGGSPEMIRYITSYLFDSRTHLNDMVDRDGKVVAEYWTLDDLPGRHPRKDVPVYVLTSKHTFSGAEEFSYNLKNLKRAALVGETTGGGAHPVRAERVNDRFMVRVPYMRAQNPITKTNWEGTGVEPDVRTPADSALDKALELARAAIKKEK